MGRAWPSGGAMGIRNSRGAEESVTLNRKLKRTQQQEAATSVETAIRVDGSGRASAAPVAPQ